MTVLEHLGDLSRSLKTELFTLRAQVSQCTPGRSNPPCALGVNSDALRIGYLAKFLGSIGQEIWCLTFHICQNPTDFGWRPALCQTSLHIIRESHKELPGGCAEYFSISCMTGSEFWLLSNATTNPASTSTFLAITCGAQIFLLSRG
jgi:hypothetical protein